MLNPYHKTLHLQKSSLAPVIPFLVLISLIPLCELIYQSINHRYLSGLLLFMIGFFLFLLPIYLFRNRPRLYLLILSPVFLLVPFNIAYVLTFNSIISEATILMVRNTSKNEASELLNNYLGIITLFFGCYLLLFFLLFRRVPRKINRRFAMSVSLFSLGFLLLCPFLLYNHDYGYIYNLRKKIGIIFPFTVVNSIKTIYDQDELIQATAKERNAFKFGSHLDSLVKGIQLHVLIIGESCRFDHWGLNGYYRNTSPHLSKRENLISFSQVASGSYMTEMSVPLLLTGVGAPNFDAHKNRKGVIGAFREAGFTTYWLTDQSDIGANIKIHSLEAEKQFYLISDFRSTKHLHQDLELLNMLREVLKSPEGKKFIVIHCIGSHYNYSSRYPDSYDLYQPSNKTVASKVTDRRYKDVLVNSYDNSILYSDAVIDSAISLVNSLDIFSSVTFVADHGEDLLDDDRDYTDHVHGSPPSKYVAHVPMFTWVSQKFEEAYPGKADYLLEHKQSPISTEDLMPTLCSMAGIFYHGQDSTRDFSSAAFLNSSQLLRGENGKIYSFSDMK